MVRVKINKFMEVRVIENIEFYVDFDPKTDDDDQSSWVFYSATDAHSANSSMEDEQFGVDEESHGDSLEMADALNQPINNDRKKIEALRLEKLQTFNKSMMDEMHHENSDQDLNFPLGPVTSSNPIDNGSQLPGPSVLQTKPYQPNRNCSNNTNSRNHRRLNTVAVSSDPKMANLGNIPASEGHLHSDIKEI